MKTCECCGKPFEPNRKHPERNQRFCSRVCGMRANHRHGRPRKRITLSCEVCGKPFETHPYRIKTAKVCSLKCLYALRHKRASVSLICAWCGKTFYRIRARNSKLPYCSKECLKQGTGRPYSAGSAALYISPQYAPDWRNIRRRILRRDHYACRICGCAEKLHVHHVDHDTTHNDPSNLITLCASCNSKETWNRLVYEPIIRKLLMSTST